MALKKIKPEIILHLKECAEEAIGIYPKATIENGIKTERTEWQNGWNSAIIKRTKLENKFLNWYKEIPTKYKKCVTTLLIKEELYLSLDEDNNVTMFILLNNIFAWACSDYENVTFKDLHDIYTVYLKDNKWGTIKWACVKRNEKPQDPIVEKMKEDGSWDKKMEALPDNYYWTKIKERGEVNDNTGATKGSA